MYNVFSPLIIQQNDLTVMQIRDLFVLNVEPNYFIQYCCHWLLPALILHEDTSNLKWIAKVGDFELLSFLFLVSTLLLYYS